MNLKYLITLLLAIFLAGLIWESSPAEEPCDRDKRPHQINWNTHGTVTGLSNFYVQISNSDFLPRNLSDKNYIAM